MPMRLCVIGNSHLAAMKLGWDQSVAADPALREAVAPVFFGAPRDGMRHVKMDASGLHPRKPGIREHFLRTSGGAEAVEWSRYDAFLLVGLNASLKRTLRFYKTHAWFGQGGTGGKTVVSPGFAREFLTERYRETLIYTLASGIAAAARKPVYAFGEPHWASWAQSSGEGPDYGWAAAIAAGDAASIGSVFGLALRDALAPHAVLIAQPDETVQDCILTKADYNKDASPLITGEGGETDASHMNAAYGAACWAAFGQVALRQGETV